MILNKKHNNERDGGDGKTTGTDLPYYEYRSFFDFNWKKREIPRILKDLKFVTPTEIQQKAIPLGLAGKNVIGQSKTGTGKTLAFVTPVVDHLDPKVQGIQALAITPTRELCVQVSKVFHNVASKMGFNVLQVYGGVDINRQKKALRSNTVSIVVATPGRLIDLYKQRFINFKPIKCVILDEADRMLDMGFMPDIEYIFGKLPRKKKLQLMLFSATIFQEIMDSINKITKGDHTIVRVGRNEDEFVIKEIDQEKYVILDRRKKYSLLKQILRREKPKHCLIFSNTIAGVEYLYRKLKRDFNFPILALTGNVNQNKREKILKQFKTHQINHLIATDVASRGLDIPNITHVINYDVPHYPENYVHRIGRTGRLNKQKGGKTNRGKAITICVQDDLIYMQRIEQLIQKEIPKKQTEENSRPMHPFLR
ncbi:DEAD/DEAH box helicase [Candidatus Bathyarchaeota archaeon]|nr:DEAD/DEAH box helicase [Candidatus Bathyarchaeota archaeon]